MAWPSGPQAADLFGGIKNATISVMARSFVLVHLLMLLVFISYFKDEGIAFAGAKLLINGHGGAPLTNR